MRKGGGCGARGRAGRACSGLWPGEHDDDRRRPRPQRKGDRKGWRASRRKVGRGNGRRGGEAREVGAWRRRARRGRGSTGACGQGAEPRRRGKKESGRERDSAAHGAGEVGRERWEGRGPTRREHWRQEWKQSGGRRSGEKDNRGRGQGAAGRLGVVGSENAALESGRRGAGGSTGVRARGWACEAQRGCARLAW